MLKTFALTAALAASAFVVGYQADFVAGKMMEIRAYMQGAMVDPEASFWRCYTINDNDPQRCEAQAQAWAARDGADALFRITTGMVTRDIAKAR